MTCMETATGIDEARAVTMARSIGIAMAFGGPEWRVTSMDRKGKNGAVRVVLKRGAAGEKGIRLTFQENGGATARIVVSGVYPLGEKCECLGARSCKPGESVPSITVAANREPRSIAEEIVRRFLPDYWQRNAAAQRERDKMEEERFRRFAVVNGLAMAGATDVLDKGGAITFTIHGVRGRMTLAQGGPCNLSLTLPDLRALDLISRLEKK